MPKSVFTEAYATFLAALVGARKERGVSQTELASRLGTTQQFVSRAERGDRRIDVVEFYAIMKALGADPERVFAEMVRQMPERVEI